MVASKYSVLLDTNILMSKTLRDWILLLAVKSEYEFFTPHVSSGIMDEFGYHVRRANPAISDVVLEKLEATNHQVLHLMHLRVSCRSSCFLPRYGRSSRACRCPTWRHARISH